jgi:hypothetical protein
LAPSANSYDVSVHYFDDHGDGVVTAILKVYTYGVLTWEGTKVLERNDVWEAGQVNWPDGTFGVNSADPISDGGIKYCF